MSHSLRTHDTEALHGSALPISSTVLQPMVNFEAANMSARAVQILGALLILCAFLENSELYCGCDCGSSYDHESTRRKHPRTTGEAPACHDHSSCCGSCFCFCHGSCYGSCCGSCCVSCSCSACPRHPRSGHAPIARPDLHEVMGAPADLSSMPNPGSSYSAELVLVASHDRHRLRKSEATSEPPLPAARTLARHLACGSARPSRASRRAALGEW